MARGWHTPLCKLRSTTATTSLRYGHSLKREIQLPKQRSSLQCGSVVVQIAKRLQRCVHRRDGISDESPASLARSLVTRSDGRTVACSVGLPLRTAVSTRSAKPRRPQLVVLQIHIALFFLSFLNRTPAPKAVLGGVPVPSICSVSNFVRIGMFQENSSAVFFPSCLDFLSQLCYHEYTQPERLHFIS